MFVSKHSDLTEKIIGAFFEVYNELGYGFSESVYENALLLELENNGLQVEHQMPIKVYYHGQVIGQYWADILVNDVVILELKAVRQILQEHEAQLLNYLKATQYEVGLLLNFGTKAQHLRKIYDNNRKGSLKWVHS
ncbi:MAG: GxxExxY protein [Anaerolineales bacterium]